MASGEESYELSINRPAPGARCLRCRGDGRGCATAVGRRASYGEPANLSQLDVHGPAASASNVLLGLEAVFFSLTEIERPRPLKAARAKDDAAPPPRRHDEAKALPGVEKS